MSLSGDIMNLQEPRKDDCFWRSADRLLYKEGHRDARHAAAELAIAAEQRIEELELALRSCLAWHQGDKWRDGNTVQRASWEDHANNLQILLDNP